MLIQKVLETYLSITTVSLATVNTVSDSLFIKAMSNYSTLAEDRSDAPINFVSSLKWL